MKTEKFLGHDCVSLENGILKLLVTQSIGPRILSLGFVNGENLLIECPQTEEEAQTLADKLGLA